MNSNAEQMGQWKLVKILGSGGFGQVSLWCNHLTGQKIAIKKLLDIDVKGGFLKGKVIERWCNEVEIMKKLNHANIVATLEIPSDFGAVDLPVLAMEYCSNGDLRKVLNKAENCCGLPESDVVSILRDISSGLAYLHSCKIIHRDIKPDNIVLQEKDSKIIYKLIDLGYAKALDQNSLSESFVGTIQYIAPELFMGKAYTSSVDYWSFGLMTHEIITGYRPFLPGRNPSEWMKQIQNKSRNIICVAESNSGEIMFHENISRKNHSSRCFLDDIEKWLQLSLDWNGQTRGRDSEKKRLVIFETLNEILCKKLIKVFSLPTYEILSYEIISATDILDLKHWLRENTHIQEGNQLLLLPNGTCLNDNGNLLRNLESEKLDRSVVTLFLLDNSGPISIKTEGITTPISLEELKNWSNRKCSYRQLKRHYAESVYFLQTQATFYRYLLQAIKAKVTHTKRKTIALESLYEDLIMEWNRIENYGHFLSLSHKIDLENYIYYRKAGKLKSSPIARKWIQNAIDINNKITELRSSFNKIKQRQLVLLAKQSCRNLDDNSNDDQTQQIFLDNLVEKGQILWKNLQKLCENDTNIPLMRNGAIDELIDRAIEERNKFLKSETLRVLLTKIWETDKNLAAFLSQLKNIYKSVNLLKCLIEYTQLERQKEVWSLIENGPPSESVGNSTTSGDSEIPKGGYDDSENSKYKESKICKISSSDLCSAFDSGSLSLSDIHNTYSIIEDNNHLRFRIQEVQQTCKQMLEEMDSLKCNNE